MAYTTHWVIFILKVVIKPLIIIYISCVYEGTAPCYCYIKCTCQLRSLQLCLYGIGDFTELFFCHRLFDHSYTRKHFFKTLNCLGQHWPRNVENLFFLFDNYRVNMYLSTCIPPRKLFPKLQHFTLMNYRKYLEKPEVFRLCKRYFYLTFWQVGLVHPI